MYTAKNSGFSASSRLHTATMMKERVFTSMFIRRRDGFVVFQVPKSNIDDNIPSSVNFWFIPSCQSKSQVSSRVMCCCKHLSMRTCTCVFKFKDDDVQTLLNNDSDTLSTSELANLLYEHLLQTRLFLSASVQAKCAIMMQILSGILENT